MQTYEIVITDTLANITQTFDITASRLGVAIDRAVSRYLHNGGYGNRLPKDYRHMKIDVVRYK